MLTASAAAPAPAHATFRTYHATFAQQVTRRPAQPLAGVRNVFYYGALVIFEAASRGAAQLLCLALAAPDCPLMRLVAQDPQDRLTHYESTYLGVLVARYRLTVRPDGDFARSLPEEVHPRFAVLLRLMLASRNRTALGNGLCVQVARLVGVPCSALEAYVASLSREPLVNVPSLFVFTVKDMGVAYYGKLARAAHQTFAGADVLLADRLFWISALLNAAGVFFTEGAYRQGETVLSTDKVLSDARAVLGPSFAADPDAARVLEWHTMPCEQHRAWDRWSKRHRPFALRRTASHVRD